MVRIIVGEFSDEKVDVAVLYESVVGRAFGPLFDRGAEAEQFLCWLEANPVEVDHEFVSDAWSVPPDLLEKIVRQWRRKQEWRGVFVEWSRDPDRRGWCGEYGDKTTGPHQTKMEVYVTLGVMPPPKSKPLMLCHWCGCELDNLAPGFGLASGARHSCVPCAEATHTEIARAK